MTRQQRFQVVRERRAPDYMPLWPRVMFQMIFSYGLLLPDVTGVDWYDTAFHNIPKFGSGVQASVRL